MYAGRQKSHALREVTRHGREQAVQRPVSRERIIPNPKLKLLEQVQEVMRLKPYSIRTERFYSDWIRRYLRFQGMKSREDLDGEERKIERFLSDLAVKGEVSASTQNQAFNALLFLYRDILGQELGSIQALRAQRPAVLPTVLTAQEARQAILAMRDAAIGGETALRKRAEAAGSLAAASQGRGLRNDN